MLAIAPADTGPVDACNNSKLMAPPTLAEEAAADTPASASVVDWSLPEAFVVAAMGGSGVTSSSLPLPNSTAMLETAWSGVPACCDVQTSAGEALDEHADFRDPSDHDRFKSCSQS